ncbi:hypothetical protein P7K49_033370 [Saguinus oedipus]|uniref:Uncharacterized protein n=1 Tax=Saguinus oedipus TaxID=9490 RepID=A0ABQ9TRQ4_SAGOE|nr:hypothetical protein P7K49_033370 [Saguinus oedipus]
MPTPRFQANPEANWGPRRRSHEAAAVCPLPRGCCPSSPSHLQCALRGRGHARRLALLPGSPHLPSCCCLLAAWFLRPSSPGAAAPCASAPDQGGVHTVRDLACCCPDTQGGGPSPDNASWGRGREARATRSPPAGFLRGQPGSLSGAARQPGPYLHWTSILRPLHRQGPQPSWPSEAHEEAQPNALAWSVEAGPEQDSRAWPDARNHILAQTANPDGTEPGCSPGCGNSAGVRGERA